MTLRDFVGARLGLIMLAAILILGRSAPVLAACYVTNPSTDTRTPLTNFHVSHYWYMPEAIRQNRDLSSCVMSQVTSLKYLFDGKDGYTGDISGWDVSAVTEFTVAFRDSDFNGDISGWDVSSATLFNEIFSGSSFSGDLSRWDVSNVTNFQSAFYRNTLFNSDISGWDVSNGTNFQQMFAENTTFDKDIRSWNVGAGAALGSMFRSATAFQNTYSVGDTPLASFFNPTTVATAPTSLVATPSDGQVSVAFTAPANTGGAAITDYEYQLDGGTWTSASTTSSPVVITGLTNGTSYSIKLRAVNSAGNGAESVAVSVDTPSPESAFAEHEADIRNTLVGDASRSLRSSVTANQRMTQSARSRFISARQAQAREEEVTRALIPFDVVGNFTLSESGLSTAGNFFQQVGNEEGTYRRLFFGDFDVQHDNDTDSTTATLTGRMAWEHMTSEQTMLGYFIGGELATSTIGGSFEGDQDHIGVTAGAYVVHELAEQVYFDGFASVGAGRNNLEMANDTLALESEYTTQTATLGGAITGVYSQKGYDFKPELAFSYGKTWLGDIGFTGRAYGLVDNTLSLDAGDVSIASLTLRPEVIIPIGADFVADTNTQLSFAPRLVCEQIKSTTKTSDCGTGGELGFSSTSEDGLSSADMRILMDRINGGTRSSFVFSVEHKF